MTHLPHIASRVFHTPLMIDQKKLAAILAVLAPRLGLEPPAVDAALLTEQRSRKPYAVTDAGIAVIEVSGSLVNRASGMDAQSGLTSYEQLGNEILDAATDPQVRGILLRLDSYGGEANGAWDVASLIEEAARLKPVWASVDDWALSAGYLLASATDRIWVTRTGGVGSVGIIAMHLDQSGWDAANGLRYTTIFAGGRKNDFNPHEPLSDGARAVLVAEVDRLYGMFVDAVGRSKGRVTAGANLGAGDLPGHAHTASDIVSGELPHKVQKDGADVGTRRALNLVQGTRVSLAAADDPANDRVSVTISTSPPEAGEITNALGYVPANRAGDHFTGPIDCGPHQSIGGPLENMAKHSEDFAASVWDRNSGSCTVTSNAVIAPDGNQTADVITADTSTPVIQQQIAGLAEGGMYTFYIWARVPSGTRKVSLAIVDNPYAAYLAGPTQITLTTSWQRFRITGTLASSQTGLWIVVRQYAANGDDWTTGDIHLWGACLQQGNDPQKAYARTWASQTPPMTSGLAAGPTVIAAPDSTTSPLKIHGPGSNLADSTLLEITANGELILAGGSGNGYRFAELGAASNPSGWAGVLKVKTPAGATLGYILLYSNP